MTLISEIVRTVAEPYLDGRFSVEQFKAHYFASGGPATGAQFFVRVFPPAIMEPTSFDTTRDLQFLADKANIPERSITTTTTLQHYGKNVAYASGAESDSLQISFLMRNNWEERYFFERWINAISDNRDIDNKNLDSKDPQVRLNRRIRNAKDKVNKVIRNNTSQLIGTNHPPFIGDKELGGLPSNYNMAYYDTYVATIQVYTFDNVGENRMRTTFIEAFPTRVDAIELDWSEKNTVLRMNVDFSYKQYHLNPLDVAGVKAAVNFAKGLYQQARGNGPNMAASKKLASVIGSGLGSLAADTATAIANYAPDTLDAIRNARK